MINRGKGVVLRIGIPIALALATSGCATKKFVSQQVTPVNQKLATVQAQTNQQVAALSSQQVREMSQANERISTADQRAAEAATAAQQAQGTASRAMQKADENSSGIAATATAASALGAGVANALNDQLVEKADITFAFNQTTLTPQAKTALDQVAAKAMGLPRSVIELAGFTDKREAAAERNTALSRRRAEAVQRYLVMKKVPLHTIHLVGMGSEAPPEGLAADLGAVNPNPSKAELNRLARRVQVRVFGAGNITRGNASRTPE